VLIADSGGGATGRPKPAILPTPGITAADDEEEEEEAAAAADDADEPAAAAWAAAMPWLSMVSSGRATTTCSYMDLQTRAAA